MAKTYSAIQTITVGSGGASSVTFSNIPQNYTDLVVKVSARSTSTTIGLQLEPNGSTSSITTINLEGRGSGSGSYSSTNIVGYLVPSSATANTFANTEIYIPKYTSSNYKSVSADSVNENNGTSAYSVLTAWLWSNTAAITSLVFQTDGPSTNSFAQYSTFTLYGIGTGAKASGGTVTGSGNYMYHTFTASGTFIPTEQIKNAEVLVIAGGGGSYQQSGGGGAGGVGYASAYSLSSGVGYGVTIGAGGAANTNGTNSTFSFITAVGGGCAGNRYAGPYSGGSGGSGGWNAGNGSSGGAATQGSGTGWTGYGNAGGASLSYNGLGAESYGGGGGAGGAGGAGTRGSSAAGAYGLGGAGKNTWSTWITAINSVMPSDWQTATAQGYIASGGGGAKIANDGNSTGLESRPSTLGGGGAGSTTNSTPGTDGINYTGGGAGGDTGYSGLNGRAGGSGLVVIRYPIN